MLEVKSLPRQQVLDHLEEHAPSLVIPYLVSPVRHSQDLNRISSQTVYRNTSSMFGGEDNTNSLSKYTKKVWKSFSRSTRDSTGKFIHYCIVS